MPELITSGPKAGRQPCTIMGCARTYVFDGHEAVICGQHYRLVDKRIRALRTRIRRAAGRKGWTPRLIDMDNRSWDIVVQQATERAIGL